MSETASENEDQRPSGKSTDNQVKLAWPRFGAFWAITWEIFWPLFLPFLLVVAGFLVLSWFNLWHILPDLLRIGLLGLFAIVAIVSLWPLRRLRLPEGREVDFRIERRSQLAHRPVTAQSDVQATGTNSRFSEALWREHRSRMSKTLTGLQVGAPNPGLAGKDPYGLRAVVVLLLFIGFGYAEGNHLTRIESAFRPQMVKNTAMVRLDVWVSPPVYTNRPPLFLKPATTGENAVLPPTGVPEGSELVIRIGGKKGFSLDYITKNKSRRLQPGNAQGEPDSDADTAEYRHLLTIPGTARLSFGKDVINAWKFDIVPDHDPVVKFEEEPKRGRGRMLDLVYSMRDDYAVVGAVAEISPLTTGDGKSRPLVKPPDLALSLPRRGAKDARIKLSRDISRHPFAGGKVAIILVAKDGAGQTGKSAVKEFVLPARYFTKPLAAALVEQRRNLATDARQAANVASMLDIIANTAPEEFIKDKGIYTGLQVAWRSIGRAKNDDQLREALDLLWQLALAIEDGDMSKTAARLREAQEALKDALENGAGEEEINRLMKELRQAMNEYLRELSEQMARNRSEQAAPQNQNIQTIRKQDIDRMMDRIENLAKSGSKDAARQLLSELQQMMDRLQAGRHRQQRRQEGDEFNRQMNKLAEIMQQQHNLMDQTFRMQRRQQRQRKNGQRQNNNQAKNQKGKNGQQGPMTAEEYAEALKQLQLQQRALQGQLEQMMKDLEQLGVDPGQELGDAGKAMGKAEGALGKGKNGEALDQQGKALDALRRGAQAMMKQMQQNMAGQRGGTDQSGQQRNEKAGNDPLGRPQRTGEPNLNSETEVPNEIDAQAAREILEAIRRKLANPVLPKIEFNYLDRLLERQ